MGSAWASSRPTRRAGSRAVVRPGDPAPDGGVFDSARAGPSTARGISPSPPKQRLAMHPPRRRLLLRRERTIRGTPPRKDRQGGPAGRPRAGRPDLPCRIRPPDQRARRRRVHRRRVARGGPGRESGVYLYDRLKGTTTVGGGARHGHAGGRPVREGGHPDREHGHQQLGRRVLQRPARHRRRWRRRAGHRPVPLVEGGLDAHHPLRGPDPGRRHRRRASARPGWAAPACRSWGAARR